MDRRSAATPRAERPGPAVPVESSTPEQRRTGVEPARPGPADGSDRPDRQLGSCLVQLGLNLGYWGADGAAETDNLALAQEADRLGYRVCWAAEAYGSDAPTVLAWVAAQTSRIDVGAAVMQIPARTPTMTAMTAATLDTLSGGRFRLGLGRQRPPGVRGLARGAVQAPLSRTREYVPDRAAGLAA